MTSVCLSILRTTLAVPGPNETSQLRQNSSCHVPSSQVVFHHSRYHWCPHTDYDAVHVDFVASGAGSLNL